MTTTETLQERLASLRSAPQPTFTRAAPEAAPKPTFDAGRQSRPFAKSEARANKFPGKCLNCSGWVEAGAGHLGPKVDDKWTVKHIDCSQRPVEPRPPSAPDRPEQPYPNPAPGIYTVESDGDHSTFRIYIQAEDAEFAPGATLLQLLTGPDNTSSYTTLGFIKGGRFIPFKRNRLSREQWATDVKVLFENPEAVLTAKHCIACNRVLTTPESIAAGIGPWCAANA